MNKQDLKALTSLAVDRAVAAREAAGVELTDEQSAAVSGGGAAGLAYIKDPTWYGIWDPLKLATQVQVGVITQPVLTEKLAADVVAAKVG